MTKPKPKPKPAVPDPSNAVKAVIAEAEARTRARRKRVGLRVAVAETRNGDAGPTTVLRPPHTDADGHASQLLDAFGTSSIAFAKASAERLAQVCATGSTMDEQLLNVALALVDGIRPADELEAALATQIAAAHAMSLKLLWKVSEAPTREGRDSFATIVTKLQRTMVAQVDALARLRRKGEQNVTVKHVHVHRGGQAIVGTVNSTPGAPGRRSKRRINPMQPATSIKAGPPRSTRCGAKTRSGRPCLCWPVEAGRRVRERRARNPPGHKRARPCSRLFRTRTCRGGRPGGRHCRSHRKPRSRVPRKLAGGDR